MDCVSEHTARPEIGKLRGERDRDIRGTSEWVLLFDCTKNHLLEDLIDFLMSITDHQGFWAWGL